MVLAVVLANGTLNALAVAEVVTATFVAFVAVVAVVAFPDSAPDTVPTVSVLVLGLYVKVASLSCSKP